MARSFLWEVRCWGRGRGSAERDPRPDQGKSVIDRRHTFGGDLLVEELGLLLVEGRCGQSDEDLAVFETGELYGVELDGNRDTGGEGVGAAEARPWVSSI
jgi:hypothetical protein